MRWLVVVAFLGACDGGFRSIDDIDRLECNRAYDMQLTISASGALLTFQDDAQSSMAAKLASDCGITGGRFEAHFYGGDLSGWYWAGSNGW